MKKDMLLQDPIAQSVIDELVGNEDMAFYVASVSMNLSIDSSRLDNFFNSHQCYPFLKNTSTFT